MKRIASMLFVLFSFSATNVYACPGDKAMDDGKQLTPKKPTTSLSIS